MLIARGFGHRMQHRINLLLQASQIPIGMITRGSNLSQKLERLSELNALLNMDEKETVMEGEEKQDEPGKEKRSIHEKISAYKKSTQLENTEDRIGISSEICIG